MSKYLADIQSNLQDGQPARRMGWPKKGDKVKVGEEVKTAQATKSIQLIKGSSVKASIADADGKTAREVAHADAYLLTNWDGSATLGHTLESADRVSQDWEVLK